MSIDRAALRPVGTRLGHDSAPIETDPVPKLLTKKRVLRDQVYAAANEIRGHPGNEPKKVDHVSVLHRLRADGICSQDGVELVDFGLDARAREIRHRRRGAPDATVSPSSAWCASTTPSIGDAMRARTSL